MRMNDVKQAHHDGEHAVEVSEPVGPAEALAHVAFQQPVSVVVGVHGVSVGHERIIHAESLESLEVGI